jgi:hypothetical protein
VARIQRQATNIQCCSKQESSVDASHIQGLIQDFSGEMSQQQNMLVSDAAAGIKEQLVRDDTPVARQGNDNPRI